MACIDFVYTIYGAMHPCKYLFFVCSLNVWLSATTLSTMYVYFALSYSYVSHTWFRFDKCCVWHQGNVTSCALLHCGRLHVYGLVQSVLFVTLCAMFCALHHVSLPFWARVGFICGMLRCSRATLRNERVVTCETPSVVLKALWTVTCQSTHEFDDCVGL